MRNGNHFRFIVNAVETQACLAEVPESPPIGEASNSNLKLPQVLEHCVNYIYFDRNCKGYLVQ